MSIYFVESILKGNRHFMLAKMGETRQPIFPSSFESLSVGEDQMINFATYNLSMHWLFTVATLHYLGTIKKSHERKL